MAHRCTKCGKLYATGDMRLLQGCECGNNKFLYVPDERKSSEPEKVEEEIKREFAEMGVETVRILSPGRYEINIERLLQGEGIIIALQEDGRYVIHLPSLLKKRKGER